MINSKKIIMLLFCIISIKTFSQNSTCDTIKLTNGNIMSGKCVMYKLDECIKILIDNEFYFFAIKDIKEIKIHSIKDYTNGFDISSTIKTENLQENKPSLKNYILFETPEQKKNAKKLDDKYKFLPQNLYFIQMGLDHITWGPYSGILCQYKLSAIYSHRLQSNTAIGGGYSYRRRYESAYNNLFFDIRQIYKTPNGNFNYLALDLGLGANSSYSILDTKSFILNPSYSYAIRTTKNCNIAIGVDLYFQTNCDTSWGNALDLGVTLGINFSK